MKRFCCFLISLMVIAHPFVSVNAKDIPAKQHQKSKADYIKGIKNDRSILDLRQAFDAYSAKEESHVLEKSATDCPAKSKACLNGFPNKYFASKFCLLVKDENPFGGVNLVIISQKYPDTVFTAWMFPDRSYDPKGWVLRAITENPATSNKEQLKLIQSTAKECIKDPSMGF